MVKRTESYEAASAEYKELRAWFINCLMSFLVIIKLKLSDKLIESISCYKPNKKNFRFKNLLFTNQKEDYF